ncbi:MAG TPA: diacylglycerol kinase family protein [Candidatus Woesebacteria bacterium]|nr:diacylglycerol kinase family protein [Candidatus Woesebacteria bacterium]
MYNPLRRHKVSFRHAFDGFLYAIRTQPNFRFHLLATIAVILLGVYFSISFVEWLILVFTINMVLVAELVNTAIEAMVDLITLEKRVDAKTAKDVAAAMVLISAGLSIIIGLIIFLPKILSSF